jgi:hypothetical protein
MPLLGTIVAFACKDAVTRHDATRHRAIGSLVCRLGQSVVLGKTLEIYQGTDVMSGLAFRTAQKHVENYEKESHDLMAEHREAMDCLDCETFLQLGIDAFGWLMRADRELRISLSEGALEAYTEGVSEALQQLCKAWLRPCEPARKWIAMQTERGYRVDNLAEFDKCCEEMEAIVEFHERDRDGSDGLPLPIAQLRDEALSEFDRGETAEFI